MYQNRSSSSNVASRVFVGNLDTNTIEKSEIESAFSVHGKINTIDIKKGYCFIEYTNPESAQEAIAAENGKIFKGRRIDCDVAKGKKREREDFGDFDNKRKKRRENSYDSPNQQTGVSSLSPPALYSTQHQSIPQPPSIPQLPMPGIPPMQTIPQNLPNQYQPIMQNQMFSSLSGMKQPQFQDQTSFHPASGVLNVRNNTNAQQQKSVPLSVGGPQMSTFGYNNQYAIKKSVIIPFLVSPNDPQLREYAQKVLNSFMSQLSALPHIGFDISYAGDPNFFTKFNEAVQGTPRYTVVVRPENISSDSVSFRAYEFDGSTHGFENTPYLDALRYVVHLENVFAAAESSVSATSLETSGVENSATSSSSSSSSSSDAYVLGESKRIAFQNNVNQLQMLLFQSGSKIWNSFYSKDAGKDLNDLFSNVEKHLKTIQQLQNNEDPRKKQSDHAHMQNLLSSLDSIMKKKIQ